MTVFGLAMPASDQKNLPFCSKRVKGEDVAGRGMEKEEEEMGVKGEERVKDMEGE